MLRNRVTRSRWVRWRRTVIFALLIIGAGLGTIGTIMAQDTSQTKTVAPKPTPTPAIAPTVKRWFDVDTLSLATRYRIIRLANGQTASKQQQYQVTARTRFKFDSKGRYSVVG